jgi:hypothetical protein
MQRHGSVGKPRLICRFRKTLLVRRRNSSEGFKQLMLRLLLALLPKCLSMSSRKNKRKKMNLKKLPSTNLQRALKKTKQAVASRRLSKPLICKVNPLHDKHG